MKTAMQELIDRLEEHLVQSARGQLGTNRGGDYRIGLRKAIDFANEELEKEKEQMKFAFNFGRDMMLRFKVDDEAEYFYKEFLTK